MTARRPTTSRGFTLTELLIVIALIVLMIAIAVPAFRYLSGGRSLEAGTNLVGPALGTARATAIGVQKIRGVAIYREAATDRDAMVLIEEKTPLPWVSGANYSVGEWVSIIPASPPNAPAIYYVCATAHTSSAANKPASSSWRTVDTTSNTAINNGVPVLDIIATSERALFPVGVGAVAATDTYTIGIPGVILFDGHGFLISRDYLIPMSSQLAKQIQPGVADSGAPYQAQSQIALMLFDREGFANASNPTTYISDNGTPLLINRYNGTIVKGE